MGIAIGIGAGAVSGAVSGYFGSQASSAASTAAENAADTQWKIYNQQRQDMMPYTQAGYGALQQINANMPAYNKPFTSQDFLSNQDPGYQFRLSQGENAVNRAAAASGGAVGGSTLQSLGNYAQGSASQEYQAAFDRYQSQINNSYNRLASVAGLGQAAQGTLANAGSAAGAGIASSEIAAGKAQAGGNVAVGNAITGGISTGLQQYQGSQLLQAMNARPGGLQSISSSPYYPGAAGGPTVMNPSPSGGNYAGPDSFEAVG